MPVRLRLACYGLILSRTLGAGYQTAKVESCSREVFRIGD